VPQAILLILAVERRGRMVRTSDSQPILIGAPVVEQTTGQCQELRRHIEV
jgi:hypothetical protein